MMRFLSVVIVLVIASPASAKIVINVPTVPDECPGDKSWAKVMHCLKAFGEPRVIASTNTARVVEVVQKTEGDIRDAGTYLYVETDKQWRLGGMYGTESTLLAFETITISGHSGYRLDFAHSELGGVTREDSAFAPALISRFTSLYCPGDTYQCTEALTACDILIRGKVYRTFRGAVRIDKDQLAIVGDRTKAGDCAPPEKTGFRWPAPK